MPTYTGPANNHSAVTNGGWSSPSNAFASSGDDVYATVQPAAATSKVGDFGFANVGAGDIPNGATIDEVRLVAETGMDAAIAEFGLQGRLSQEIFHDSFEREVSPNAWANGWVLEYLEPGTTVDVTNGLGRMYGTTANGSQVSFDVHRPNFLTGTADGMLAKFRVFGDIVDGGQIWLPLEVFSTYESSGHCWHGMWLVQPPTTVHIKLYVGASFTEMASFEHPDPWTEGDWWWLRVQHLNGELKAKGWKDGNVEPDWQASVTTNVPFGQMFLVNPFGQRQAETEEEIRFEIDAISVTHIYAAQGSEILKTTTPEGLVTYTFPANSVSLADLRSASALLKARARGTLT